MASPKVSWQRCRYTGRWNMRPLPDGGTLMKIQRKPLHPKCFVYDVYLGICKHVKFAPDKAEGPYGPPITNHLCGIKASQKRKNEHNKQ